MIKTPEITLIPPEYANSEKAEFSLIGKKIQSKEKNLKKPKKPKKPIITDSFFLLWLPLTESVEELNFVIKKIFPQIPLEKAFTCSIKIAYPSDFIKKNGETKKNKNGLILHKTIGKIIPIPLSTDILIDIPLIMNVNERKLLFSQQPISGSAYFWSLALKLALQLIVEGNFIPVVLDSKNPSEENLRYVETDIEGRMTALWRPILHSKDDFEKFRKILNAAPLSAHAIPVNHSEIIAPSILLLTYLNQITDLLIRNFIKMGKYTAFQTVYGFSPNDASKLKEKIPWEVRLLASLVIKNNKFDLFNVSERAIPDIINKWTKRVDHPYWKDGYNLSFKLELPKDKSNKWMLRYFIQSILGKKETIPLGNFWDYFEKKEKDNNSFSLKIRRNVLASLNGLGLLFSPINKSLQQKSPRFAEIDTSEAYIFLERVSHELRADGFVVKIPDVFAQQGKQRLKPVLRINSEEKEFHKLKNGDKTPTEGKIKGTLFDINSILTYRWELKIGNKTLSDQDFNKLLESKDPLIFQENKWVLLNRKELDIMKDLFKKGNKGTLPADEALSLGLSNQAYIKGKNGDEEESFGPYEVVLEGTIETVIDTLTGQIEPKRKPQPKALNGKLRPYQLDGFNWLFTMANLGFNVCLADDMGLGKTIQTISYFLEKSENKPKYGLNSLVICPTSVMGNWKKEFINFAPALEIGFYYGGSRPSNLKDLITLLGKKDVILTSYGILRRDIKLLSLINWDIVTLDESQNIKNHKTKQAQAAYKLNADTKICLTGTPIENRISEIWSMFHFLNPFLLKRRKNFLKKYRIPIERFGDPNVGEQLRKIIMPFLLRRLKSDKKIIKDLPDKQEIKLYIDLTEHQKRLYTKIVEEGLKKIEAIREIESKKSEFKRKGAILNTIMKLKQVCNHPAQALHEEIEVNMLESLENFILKSGKLQRLIEMLEEIIYSGDKILIFSQFTALLKILEKIISEKLNIDPLFLHGGVPQKKREEIINQFQDDMHNTSPIFLLSLKAGGTGLNLTAASIVLHFDRWWNPAVENQATDRAYRIGQKKNVMVYKMISIGTIEEKIDEMIEQKKEIAELLISSSSSGEQWITELSDNDLKKLFQLESTFGG
ncbi:MAG: DEAD/DEAH box helicase [Promethearchaeota archaeon]